MMKKIKLVKLFLFLLFGFLLVVPNLNAEPFFIFDGEWTNVGPLDPLVVGANKLNPSPVSVKDWVIDNNEGNFDIIDIASITVIKNEIDEDNPNDPFYSVYSFNGVTYDIENNYIAFPLLNLPQYFYVKIATNHFFFENSNNLNWAVVNKPDRRDISHVGEFGGGTPVPEPSTMLLLGMGLIGLVSLKRRVVKN